MGGPEWVRHRCITPGGMERNGGVKKGVGGAGGARGGWGGLTRVAEAREGRWSLQGGPVLGGAPVSAGRLLLEKPVRPLKWGEETPKMRG